MQRLDFGLYSYPKEFGGWGVGGWGMKSEPVLTPKEKSTLPEKILLRGGSNPRRGIKQDSEPNTLPTSYSVPGAQW